MTSILNKLFYVLSSMIWLLTIIIVDQISKLWALTIVQDSNGIYFVTSFFSILIMLNTGIIFGFFADNNWGIIPFVAIAIIIICYLIWIWSKNSKIIDGICLMSVVAGATSNVYDRIRIGGVIDFLDLHYQNYHWPAFNVADSAIVIGIISYILRRWYYDKKQHLNVF